MIDFIRTVLHPAWYHGHGRRPPFFEGWYYKVVDKREQARYAFIPGVFIHQDPAKTHSFIQVLDGTYGSATYHRFATFEAKPHAFNVRIADNHFSTEHIHLNLDDEQGRVCGELHFEGLTPWPVTLASPGIMGWYGWLPVMETYHGVLSLDHRIIGRLEVNGQVIDFTDGRGYIEKDWGTSFPSGYIWMQTNHFNAPHTSLTASIAVIPNLGRRFAGFIVGFWHNGMLYRFTTYNGSKVFTLRVSDTIVEWTLYNRYHELQILATRAEGGLLKGPLREDMHMRVDETMIATAELRLLRLDGFRKTLIFEGHGRNTALEVVGDLSLLVTDS
ncbi:MAG: tocopherol cyclase family protein [Anaerolineae bacterium]|nr:tocopherol cyclase family protein [Anaerolineae bacterium]MDW8170944.1 tocopherol cyclase family protein [Anaerolineae bacterium]